MKILLNHVMRTYEGAFYCGDQCSCARPFNEIPGIAKEANGLKPEVAA